MESLNIRSGIPNLRRPILRMTLYRRKPKYKILFFSFLCVPFFFCNGILPPFVMHLCLINEYIFLSTFCVFTLYTSKFIIIANKIKLLPF